MQFVVWKNVEFLSQMPINDQLIKRSI